MADIINSLIIPRKGSHDSFHSTHSALVPDDDPATTDELTLHDVDGYLSDPRNQAVLASKARFVAAAGPKPSPQEPPQPVLISNTKSSQNIQTLYTLCQQRGIVPAFELDGEASDWGGWLRINEHNIGSDQRWPNKKAAREGLAEKAIEFVKSIEVGAGSSGDTTQTNWVGKLLEYHNIASPSDKATYNDYAVGNLFACECFIPFREAPFGGKENAFTTKKAARSNAAKEAVEYLISNGSLNPDGSIKARKKINVGSAVKMEGKHLNFQKSASYSQRVTDFCPMLGLTAPTYQFSAASPNTPNLLTGFATFPGAIGLPSRIGEVRNVFGKKNAKEECAREIWQELKLLARKRGFEMADSDED